MARTPALAVASLCLIGCGRDPVFIGEPRSSLELMLLTVELPAGDVGLPYGATLLADGPEPDVIQWSIESGGVPGLELRLATGASAVLAGIPSAAGRHAIEIGASDRLSAIRRSYSVEIADRERPLEIQLSMLPSGRTGETYIATIGASGGTWRGYRWRIVEGQLPLGLTLSPTDSDEVRITGRPSVPGDFRFMLEVEDDGGNTDRELFQLSIEDDLRIVTSSLPAATASVFYLQRIEARGGSGTFVWEAEGLPPGLSIAIEGTPFTTISGTTHQPGSYDVLVRVYDANGVTERSLQLVVGDELRILTPSLPPGEVGVPYQALIDTTGGSLPLAWQISGGPRALTKDELGQQLRYHGTPLEAGVFQVRFEVSDALGQIDARSYSLQIEEPELAILTSQLPVGIEGEAYQATIEASGGAGGYEWTAISGALPPGLALDPSGTPATSLFGAPAVAGSFTFTVQVTDSNDRIATRELTLDVDPPPPPLEITTSTLAPATLCSGYNQELRATGGTGTGYRWSASGLLPDGLSLRFAGTPAGGLLGAPRDSGSFPITITVSDDAGHTASRSFTLIVGATGGSAWTVLGGDLTTESQAEVFAVDLCGGSIGSLHTISEIPAGRFGGISSLGANTRMSPDRRRVAFLGDFGFETVIELYAVDLSGSIPGAQLAATGPIATNQDVLDFAWSPDGSKLAFRGDLDSAQKVELYVIDLLAPTPQRLKVNGPLPPTGDVREGYRWSPSGDQIAYRADQISDQTSELFVVDVSGPTPGPSRRVNTDLTAGGQVDEHFLFSPDGTQLLFLAPIDSLGVAELYLAAVSGPTPGAPIKVNGALIGNGDVRAGDFAFAPDGSALFYVADAFIDDLDELFLVRLTGGVPGAPATLHPAAIDVSRAQWSPDSGRLLYLAEASSTGIHDLFLVGVGGAAPTPPARVTPPYAVALNTNGFIASGALDLGWSSDGRWIAFRDRVQGVTRAFVVEAAGTVPGARTRVDGTPVAPSQKAGAVEFSLDCDSLVVRGDLDTPGVDELYLVPLVPAPGAPLKLNPPLITGGDVSLSPGDVAFTDDGFILYRADQAADNVFEIHRVHPNFPGASVRLHPPLSSGHDASLFRVR